MAAEDPKGCRYCDTAERTREHALASQLAELIPQPPSMTAERLRIASGTAESLSEWTTSTPANVVVRDFCGDCNSGWMNDLDTAIKAEFADLCRGTPVMLDTGGIEQWRRWIVKQYLSYLGAYPEDYSRPADYQAFYGTREPLPGMQVYLGLGADLPWPHIHGQRPLFLSPLFSTDPAERRLGLQLWTAGYGQLAIQVVHVYDPQFDARRRPDSQPVVRLWPDPPDALDLSRPLRLDTDGFAKLTKHRPLFEPW
jgi:hypothetical protein